MRERERRLRNFIRWWSFKKKAQAHCEADLHEFSLKNQYPPARCAFVVVRTLKIIETMEKKFLKLGTAPKQAKVFRSAAWEGSEKVRNDFITHENENWTIIKVLDGEHTFLSRSLVSEGHDENVISFIIVPFEEGAGTYTFSANLSRPEMDFGSKSANFQLRQIEWKRDTVTSVNEGGVGGKKREVLRFVRKLSHSRGVNQSVGETMWKIRWKEKSQLDSSFDSWTVYFILQHLVCCWFEISTRS